MNFKLFLTLIFHCLIVLNLDFLVSEERLRMVAVCTYFSLQEVKVMVGVFVYMAFSACSLRRIKYFSTLVWRVFSKE
jgi:hypothetical protein